MSERLHSARNALQHQREWFADVQRLVSEGEQIALVNADVPHEILRAFDIPYVVNQWWSSVAASRGGAQRYLDLVTAEGYPRTSEQYNAIGLGSAFDANPEEAPWGGLPKPFVVLGDLTGDTTRKVFDAWAAVDGVDYFSFENPAENLAPTDWWEGVSTDWECIIGTERIDLMVAELQDLIEYLGRKTGRMFSMDRLEAIMDLSNQHAEWNRKTRDLLARVRPMPVSINDSIPAVMLPQWHRGSEWGVLAARSLFFEVKERSDAGQALVPEERARLMWIGRGLWFDLDFYRHFEEQYGAVFVWSMYLGIAADGYARYGEDPLRALASRFVAFNEFLYVPPKSSSWYVHEAQKHGVTGVVHLVSDDPRGNWATTEALRAAGFPVIEVHADNSDDSAYDVDEFRGGVAQWLENDVLP